MLGNIDDICTSDQADSFTCPNGRTVFSSSVIWGLIGPKRLYSVGKIYSGLLHFFWIGALMPIITWLLYKKTGKEIFRWINWPLIFVGTYNVPPATGINYSSWALVNWVFNGWIKRRFFAWWTKYNYGELLLLLLLLPPPPPSLLTSVPLLFRYPPFCSASFTVLSLRCLTNRGEGLTMFATSSPRSGSRHRHRAGRYHHLLRGQLSRLQLPGLVGQQRLREHGGWERCCVVRHAGQWHVRARERDVVLIHPTPPVPPTPELGR